MTPRLSAELTIWLKERAIDLGFTAIGITSAKGHDFSQNFEHYLSKSYHGEMNWLGERVAWRSRPHSLWPEAKSIIMLAESYLPPTPQDDQTKAIISSYALGRDYHDIVKKRLKALGRELIAKASGEIKVFVDTAPVMEKPLAQLAGIGWQGKHGNLVSRQLGNWFFLGAIFTTLDLVNDTTENDHCGSCQACIKSCPTQAFDKDGHLDPRRCISYLTIESPEIIPLEFRRALGNLVYGCDICLSACPWNKFAHLEIDPRLKPKPERQNQDLSAFLQLDKDAFRALFSGSPVKRIGWAKFISNCLIAAGNSRDLALLPHITPYLSHDEALLHESAKWAHSEIISHHFVNSRP